MNSEEKLLWQQAIDFHGHSCPGLAIGFRMVLEAKALLGIEKHSADEEIVCVTENNACGVDAVQALLSCTFGKGNLIYRARGKMAMSFYCRNSGKSCRFILNPLPEHTKEISKADKMNYILSEPFSALFTQSQPHFVLPEKASLYQSQCCSRCGELTAEPMLHYKEGKPICIECDNTPVSMLFNTL